MRKLRAYRYGSFEDSHAEMGLTLKDGKYNVEWLSGCEEKKYDMYIAVSSDSLYITDGHRKDVVLKNGWRLEAYGKSDCIWGDNFSIVSELAIGSETMKVVSYTHDDFVNIVLGVTQNSKTVEEAERCLEEYGLHRSTDHPNIYLSTPVYPDYIHLNVHSHYSIGKSRITVPEAVDKAVADGMKGMALTDEGVMYGIKEFVDYCAKINKDRQESGLELFKPIIGCEVYVAPRTMQDKAEGDDRCGRLIVLAKNLTGYKNLCKLVSNAWSEGLMNETPRTDHAELEKFKDGLIVIASGTNSEIANHAIAGDMDKALSVGGWYKATFGDDFYIGIRCNHSFIKEDEITERIVRSAYHKADFEYGIESVFVSACYYLNKSDMQDDACLQNAESGWMKTRAEMFSDFRGCSDVYGATLGLFNKIDIYSID